MSRTRRMVQMPHPVSGLGTFLTPCEPIEHPNRLTADDLRAVMADLWTIIGDQPPVIYMSRRTAARIDRALKTWGWSEIMRQTAGIRRRQARKQNRRRN